MFTKIFCWILILKLIQARFALVPKFYGQDSAVIVDADKSFIQTKNEAFNYPNKIRMPPPFPLWRHYPRYHIIPAPPPGQILAINTWAKTIPRKMEPTPTRKTTIATSTTTITTTTTPMPIISNTIGGISKSMSSSSGITDSEFPIELLDIAQNKLGITNPDEIPSISELGQLLGTKSSAETLSYIKQLSLNEQGIALLKAYIESTDYTDNTSYLNNKNYDLEDEQDIKMGDIDEPLEVNDDGLMVITDKDSSDDYEFNNYKDQQEYDSPKTIVKERKPPKVIKHLKELSQTKPSVMESIANFMHLGNLLHKNEENKKHHELDRITENGKKIFNGEESQTMSKNNSENITEIEEAKEYNLKTPILVRESIPFNYPVPIRVKTTIATTRIPQPSKSSDLSTAPVVHLNTPKILMPHVQQLSRVSKIPIKNIEAFLASKPKLLELATKASRFPISYDRGSPLEAQVMAAMQKALNQDEDLRKFLGSAASLK